MEKRIWHSHYDPGIPAEIDIPTMTFIDQFLKNSSTYSGTACTRFKGSALSYGEMAALIERLAASFIRLGLNKGDRLGIILPNTPQFVAVFLAALRVGAVVVPLNPRSTPAELAYQLGSTGVSMLVGLDQAAPLFEAIRAATGFKQVILTAVEDAFHLAPVLKQAPAPANPAAQSDGAPMRLLDLLAEPVPTGITWPSVTMQDTAFLLNTGGTTGTPKMVVYTYGSLMVNITQLSTWLDIPAQENRTLLAAIPFFHVYGLVVTLCTTISATGTLAIVIDPRKIEDLLETLSSSRAVAFPAVPALFAALVSNPDVQQGKIDLGSLKYCISGSSPLPPPLKLMIEKMLGVKLLEGYGLTEAMLTHCNPLYSENKTGSVGMPFPGVDCRIVSLEDGKTDLPAGTDGELLVKGPQILPGYLKMSGGIISQLEDGWLHTGDVARMDEDGYFYLTGRKKDLIKVGGFQVWPVDIETVMGSHPAVLEAVAAGVPDGENGEVVKAWVVYKPGHSASAEELRSWCGQHLARYKVPAFIEAVPSIPRSALGKVLRNALVGGTNAPG